MRGIASLGVVKFARGWGLVGAIVCPTFSLVYNVNFIYISVKFPRERGVRTTPPPIPPLDPRIEQM